MPWIDKLIPSRTTPRGVDFDALPARLKLLDGRLHGGFVIAFAVFWAGISGTVVVTAMRDGSANSHPIMLLFPLFGLGIAYLGLQIAFRRRTVVIDQDRVWCEERWLGGGAHWEAPRESYVGVLLEPTTIRQGKTSVAAWRVKLHHPEEEKAAPLLVGTDYAEARRAWEKYARLLGLAALEAHDEVPVAREIEDLDKSVRELAEEGRLEVDFEARPPPRGLVAAYEGEILVVTSTRSRNRIVAMVAIMAVPAGIIVIGLFSAPAGLLVAGFGAIFLLAIVGAVVWDLVTRERLRVDSDSLALATVWRGGERRGKHLAARRIEDVTVARSGKGTPLALLVASDAERLEFGRNQSVEALEWLRHAVLAHLAGKGPAGR